MWKIKTITLLNGSEPPGKLLRAAEMDCHQQGKAIIANAQQQAEAILTQAHQQAEHYLTQQRNEQETRFWQQAGVLFTDWQQQQELQEQQLVSLAEQLLSQAMRQLLEDFTPEQRYRTLLQQLLRQHPRQQQATLYCSGTQQEDIAACLSQQSHLVWQLSSDEQLTTDQLRLVTEQGELLVDWKSLSQQLIPQAEASQEAVNE